MAKFKNLSIEETDKIDELLKIADSVAAVNKPVIKGNKELALVLGGIVGGPLGVLIASKAGDRGLSEVVKKSTASSITKGVGIPLGISLLGPISAPILLSGYITKRIWNKIKSNSKEKQRQENYVKEITKKQQQIYNKYEGILDELENCNNEKDLIIMELREKLAEYNVIFEALKDKREYLEKNLVS